MHQSLAGLLACRQLGGPPQSAQPEVLTQELQARIVTVCATFPHWGVAQVHQHLRQQGVAVTQAQVQQAVTQSGWQQLQQTLTVRYELGATALRCRDEWLVATLLAQIAALTGAPRNPAALAARSPHHPCRLDGAGRGKPVPAPATTGAHARLGCCVWSRCCSAPGPAAPPDAAGRTPDRQYGGRPAGQPTAHTNHRRHAAGALSRLWFRPSGAQECQATPQTLLRRATATCARCRSTATTAATRSVTRRASRPCRRAWRPTHPTAPNCTSWPCRCMPGATPPIGAPAPPSASPASPPGAGSRAWGHALLPVAALFGVVRSSGVVGVDEKYVLVPKNDKPTAPMRRWMYVYLAVDVWTYDLLHIALYPHNSQDSAHAFLLALRTKGYHPQVIVTDLRQDYGPCHCPGLPQRRPS